MTKQRINRIKKQIIQSRTRLLFEHPFYALMLMHLDFVSDTKIWTMSTNGRAIFFNPDYFEKLYVTEVDFILCHQVMHILFEDIWRDTELSGHTYHHACDVVINSHLRDDVLDREAFPKLGKIYHTFEKDGFRTEGRFHKAEEVYRYCRSVPDGDEILKNGIMIDNDKWWGKLKYSKGDKTLTLIIKGDLDDTLAERTVDGKKDKDDSGDGERLYKADDCRNDWKKFAAAAMSAASQMSSSGDGAGNVPGFVHRIISDWKKPKTDWKKILNDFVQEEICDYSFSPPDRRFDGSDFFLPDFNEKDFIVKKILFFVDCSPSMSDEMISLAFSEISGVIAQYNGKFEGELGFFDVEVTTPVPFDSVEDIKKIIPIDGRGTNFFSVFNYVASKCTVDKPSVIIVFTDGEAYYPDESAAMGIPVLWMLNNYDVTPPWGKTVRCVL